MKTVTNLGNPAKSHCSHSRPFSIDDDILNLMDEVDLEQFLKEASHAMDESDDISQFFREKATFAIERFLVSRSSPFIWVCSGSNH